VALKKSLALRREEEDLAARIRDLATGASDGRLSATIDSTRRSLEELAEAVAFYPSPLNTQSLGDRERNIDTLLEALSRQTPFSIELALPTRAAVAQALAVGRLNFFRMLRRVLDEISAGRLPEHHARDEVNERIAGCIAMRASEQMLLAIVCRPENKTILRKRAALILSHLWHSVTQTDLGQMLPVLAATWQARRRLRVSFGTMLGASELFSLMAEGCDPRFIDFLTREECTTEELAAFHEFLFGLSYEEMKTAQGTSGEILTPGKLAERGLSPDDALTGTYQAGDEAERFYIFFMKRHLLAENRAQMDVPGPKKTAEQYVLSHLIEEHWDSINVW